MTKITGRIISVLIVLLAITVLVSPALACKNSANGDSIAVDQHRTINFHPGGWNNGGNNHGGQGYGYDTLSAKVISYGVGNSVYNYGQTVNAEVVANGSVPLQITIKNTGTKTITQETCVATVSRQFICITHTESGTNQWTEVIKPGETKTLTYNVHIPATYYGISTSGHYWGTMDVMVNGGTWIGNVDFGVTIK